MPLDSDSRRYGIIMHKRSLSVLFLLALLAAPALAQVTDRSVAPTPGPVPALTPPAVQKRTLSNGLPVWIVEMHKVPVANVTLAIKTGAAAEPRGRFGLANLTAEMLDEGAGSRGALEIADAVDYLGASLSTSTGFDSSSVDLHVPVARLAEALPLMADVALRPTFPDKELQRVREELLTSLLQAEDDPAALVQFAFPRIVYGAGHRYGTLTFGTAAAIKGFSSDDLRQFHAGHYVPSQSLLIVTGDVTPGEVLPQLERAFGQWTGTAAADATVPAAPQLQARKIYIVDKPGAAQSQIAIGWVGVPRSTPDYFALRVLNTVLGGAFTSRLNQNLRETHGYAYGATSAFDMRASAGPFLASAGVQTDKTAEALTEFFKELEGIRTPIPADELNRATNYLALQLPRSFETTGSVAGSLEQQFVYSLPDDYFQTYTGRVGAVTAAQVQAAAQKVHPARQVRRGHRRRSQGDRAGRHGAEAGADRPGHDRGGDEVNLSYAELLRYTGEERDKWRHWFATRPEALEAPVQPGGRLPTVGKLIDHIFLVEQRHLQRLLELTPSEQTGLTGNNAPPLFDYGASVRRELEQYVADLDEEQADQVRTFVVREQNRTMSPRKLLFHILLHEIRHWAQVALAVRLAGFEPPGDHDLFFSRALK